MGDAPAVPDQTPVVFVKAGMAVTFDTTCRKALAKSGVDPENFGSYSGRASAEKAARDEIGKNYASKAALDKALAGTGKTADDKGPVGTWLLANSQSGHVMQNAFMQGRPPGGGGDRNPRGDPCANVRPVPPDGSGDAGAYGYDMERALCMDHFGKSTVAGTPHYEITQGEADFARSLPPGARIDMGTMEQSVRRTAAIAVAGSEGRPDLEDLKGKALKEAQKFDTMQEAHAEELEPGKGKLGDEGTPGYIAGAKGKKPKGGAQGPELTRDQQMAVECIVAAWKASLDQIRKDSIAENSSEAKEKKKQLDAYNEKNGTDHESYEDVPAKDRKKLDKEVQAGVERRKRDLEKKGAGTAGAANEPPTKDDCREYQANWLSENQGRDGSLPPVAGRKPGDRTTDGGGSATSRKKSV